MRTADDNILIEQYPAITSIGAVRHGFVCRVPGLAVSTDKAAALRTLDQHHRTARERLGFNGRHVVTAEQVHGAVVEVVDAGSAKDVPGADGLITNDPSVCLGIYVADCCAVYLCDPAQGVAALLHSGKKGTGLGIAAKAIEKMRETFGTNPASLVVQLSPCISPPHYEMDFAAEIIRQCREAGVKQIAGSPANTGADLQRYYSYRMEKGCTGRMVAYLGLA